MVQRSHNGHCSARVPTRRLDHELSADRFTGLDIIALYADHGTHEQFHSEFKTDLDLERLPSGKFDSNYVVCGLAALTMNILRLMGQAGLHGPDAPVRHPAKRRRLKTVMQELIYRAGRLIEHWGGAADPWARRQRSRGHLHAVARRVVRGRRIAPRTRGQPCYSPRIPKMRTSARRGVHDSAASPTA